MTVARGVLKLHTCICFHVRLFEFSLELRGEIFKTLDVKLFKALLILHVSSYLNQAL